MHNLTLNRTNIPNINIDVTFVLKSPNPFMCLYTVTGERPVWDTDLESTR